MSYESFAEPIKVGVLMDSKFPEVYPIRNHFIQTLQLVFDDGLKRGIIDRPVEILYREVEGFPKGTIKAVIDAYADLVKEGCLMVYGPNVTDNAIPIREEIERTFRVPSISETGTEDWLGEWTFSLPMGSLTEEPVFWAHLMVKRGYKTVGALIEQSMVGKSYILNFRNACRDYGLNLVAEEFIAQTAQDVTAAVGRLHKLRPDALVHCGFGFGMLNVNPALKALDWDPPRFMGTAFQCAWLTESMWKGIEGWIGIDQYDEGNKVGQDYIDSYQKAYGARLELCMPVVNRDVAAVMLRAFADAHPLTPRGVKEAMERIKMLPAASGAPGTRVSFGKYMHRGWVGSGYLVARRLDSDGINSHLVDRFGQD